MAECYSTWCMWYISFLCWSVDGHVACFLILAVVRHTAVNKGVHISWRSCFCFFWIYTQKWSEVKVAQSCLTLCDLVDYTVRGILQVRILEWVTIPFSRGSSQPRNQTQVFHFAGRFFTSWATREAQEWVCWSYGSSSFNFFEDCLCCFHNGCTNLHSC